MWWEGILDGVSKQRIKIGAILVAGKLIISKLAEPIRYGHFRFGLSKILSRLVALFLLHNTGDIGSEMKHEACHYETNDMLVYVNIAVLSLLVRVTSNRLVILRCKKIK